MRHQTVGIDPPNRAVRGCAFDAAAEPRTCCTFGRVLSRSIAASDLLPAYALAAILLTAGLGNPHLSVAADKSQYHLFNPVPDSDLRELSPDRPDKTESAFTVDAGHFQVELDLLAYSQDRSRNGGEDAYTTGLAVMPVNLKVGLLNNMDLQVIVESWNQARLQDHVSGTSSKSSGFGDVIPRLKINLLGNDGGSLAAGVMPFVKLPLNQDDLGNDAVEGGIILPVALELPWGFSLGAMTEFDFRRNELDHDYHTEFVNSVTLGHDLVGKLSGYAEFYTVVSTESGADWIGTVDCGLSYGFTPNFRLDAGVNFGVTKAAEDLAPFVGLTYRY